QNESSQRRKNELQKMIRDDHAWLFDEHPNLDISIDVEIGEPMDVIADRTATAQLTVVGSRGRGAVRSALLGSVSRGVLSNAHGAVMTVPRKAWSWGGSGHVRRGSLRLRRSRVRRPGGLRRFGTRPVRPELGRRRGAEQRLGSH